LSILYLTAVGSVKSEGFGLKSVIEVSLRVLVLQMKSFEDKYNSSTVVTELNLSSHSLQEKPRVARSLLQEMETEGTLVKRVQMLEDRLNGVLLQTL